MTQNTSHAVMAQRTEAIDSLDHFPTPPWATRALCKWIEAEVEYIAKQTAWEPACAEGHMVLPLREYFAEVSASAIHWYGGLQEHIGDFLKPGAEPPRIWGRGVDWIITNPPFRLAEEFIARSLRIARVGAAFLVRTSFLEGVGRYERLFAKTPPATALQFSERVVMHKGKLVENGSTATSYCWLVWLQKPTKHPRMGWISPCRRALEKPDDYTPLSAGEGIFG